MRIHSVTVFSCAVMLLTLAGCPSASTRPEVELVPVDGTVTMDGEPLAGASVMFGGGSAMGETDANGHYELARGDRKGVTVGDHTVVIEKWVTEDGSPYKSDEVSPMEANAKQEIPAKYSNGETTELKATVPAAGGTIDFELKSE